MTPPSSPSTGDRYIVPDNADGDWYAVGGTWDYRQEITISSTYVDANQTDFPVLILIDSPGNHVFRKTQDDGDDILFTKADKLTKLDHELEIYVNDIGEEYAEIYVETNITSATDTTIYMYYSNAAASAQSNENGTWKADYDLVYHMTDKTTSTIDDSTSTDSDIDKAAADEPAEVGIHVGKSQFHDGTNDYMDTNQGYDYSGEGAFTVMMWVQGARTGNNYLFCQSHLASYSSDWILGYNNNGLWFRSQQVNGGNVIADGELHQIGFTFDGTDAQLYIDGVSYGSAVTPTGYGADGSSVKIMARGDAASVYTGIVDEAWVATAAMSATWIQTEFNNRTYAELFAVPGDPESAPTSGDWAGYGDYITTWSGSAWTFEGAAVTGWSVYVEDVSKIYVYDGDDWVSTDYSINHNQLSGIQGGADGDNWHLKQVEHTSATRIAGDLQDGLMPAGRLSYWNNKWTVGKPVTDDIYIELATPGVILRDTDDDSAYKLYHDAGDATYPNLGIYRGDVTEEAFISDPASPLMYWNDANDLTIRTSSDADNFLTFSTASNEPTMTATGNLNIIASTGAIGFGNENLTTTGQVTADSFKLVGGAYKITLDPGTPTETLTYTLPPADGTAGQQLSTDGSATLSWAEEGAVDQLLWQSITADSGNATATSTSSDLDVLGGSGLDTAMASDELTINITANGVNDTHIDWGTGANQVSAVDIPMAEVAGATYDDIQDWSNTTQSGGIISGLAITDSTGGEIDIAAGTGILKTTASQLGANVFFNYAGTTNFALTDNDVNYIYIDYDGGTPVAAVTLTRTDINHWDEIGIGRVYREGTALHILSAGVQIHDIPYRIHKRLAAVDGFVRATGLQTSETGTLEIAITAGVMWTGITEVSVDAIDTTDDDVNEDQFSYWYYDGDLGTPAWVEIASQNAIDNTQYNDVASGLDDLTSNQYGVHWVYIHYEGDVHIVYGQDSYTLSEAQDADRPSSLPDVVNDFSMLIAKIIIKKSEASSFTDVDTPWESVISSGTVTGHNDLSSLQGGTVDEYYHMTSAQNTIIGNTSGTNTGDDAEVNNLETVVTGIADDEIPIGSAANDSVYTEIPDCDVEGSALAYDNSTNTISCRTGFAAGSGMNNFVMEDGDGTEVSISDAEEMKFVEGTGININWTDTDPGSDADPFDLTINVTDTEDQTTSCEEDEILKADDSGGWECDDDSGGGEATDYDDIGDPDANTLIDFTSYTNTWSSDMSSGTFVTIDATVADTALDVDGDFEAEAGTFNDAVTVAGTMQSTFTEGLVVNDGSGADDDDDFRVETGAEADAFVIDASAETATFGVPLAVTVAGTTNFGGNVTFVDNILIDGDAQTIANNGDAVIDMSTDVITVSTTFDGNDYKNIAQVINYQNVTATYDIVETDAFYGNKTHVINLQPDTPREIKCSFQCEGMEGQGISSTMTITGLDAGGNVVQDVMTIDVEFEGVDTYHITDHAYRKITSIVTTNDTSDCGMASILTKCEPTATALGIPMYPLDATSDIFAVTENGVDQSSYSVATTWGKLTGITISDNDDFEIYYRRGR